jgi:K+-transporting ATPase ATPase B chain
MSVHLEAKARPLWEPKIVARAAVDSVRKLNPVHQVKNPVMFIVEVGALLTTLLALQAMWGQGEAPAGFIIAISAWLWFTVIFANFAEAMAEGRGKAQADNLRKARRTSRPRSLAAQVAAQAIRRRRQARCAGMTWCLSRPAMSSLVMAK